MQNPDLSPSRRPRSGTFELCLLLLQHLPLLVIVPAVVGAAVYGVSSTLPKTYLSGAILALPQPTLTYPNRVTPQQVASMMTSARVLDPVIDALHLGQDVNRDQARGDLVRRVKATVPKDLMVRVEVEGPTPEITQQTAMAILDSWFKSTVPSERDQADLKRRLVVATAGFENTQKALAQLLAENPQAAGRRDAGMSLAAIGELSDKYLEQVLMLPREMEGVPREVVKQAPTLPVQPVKPRKLLLAGMSAMVTFLLLLATLLLRHAIDTTAADPAGAERLRQLRAALPGVGNRREDQVHG